MNIKAASAVRAMEKAGAKITIEGGNLTAVWSLSARAEAHIQDGSILSLRVRRATDQDQLVEDYMAGTFVRTLRKAIEIAVEYEREARDRATIKIDAEVEMERCDGCKKTIPAGFGGVCCECMNFLMDATGGKPDEVRAWVDGFTAIRHPILKARRVGPRLIENQAVPV